ncbi:VCBS repeat-containing protein [Mucilaginibacter sp.]|uniref:FG-GAP repeat domain-containing protein n=1 Tax=Mucilaginibacter sp. TaxID=1882438 RepID=UPI0032679569
MQLKKTSLIVLALLALTTGICVLSVSCGNSEKKIAETDGQGLSKKYCVSCHKYPEPALLDQDTWAKHVLPAMAPHLGIKVYAEDQYVNNPSSNSGLGYEDWLKIVEYYKSAAPKKLKPATVPIAPLKDWAGFKLNMPNETKATPATTTMVAFDTISHQLFTGDRATNRVYMWSDKLKLRSATGHNSPAVDVQFGKDKRGEEYGSFTFIGSMDAVDVSNGSVVDIPLKKFGSAENLIADKLPRPVQSLSADFDKDGLEDRIVCGFGHNFGGLFLYKQVSGNQYRKSTISSIPGAEQAVIGDFNKDGWPDIACLFAQADEGIWMFLNDHQGGFTTKNLLRFPPVYGSTSFQLIDFNNDGKLDILYTCGDNGDFSRVLKPYHGVYIFLNQGDLKFKQTWFYPVNGATKAIAADFNGDGKPDIASIAFFSDLKDTPDEGFTYFEQDAGMQFIPHRLPINTFGRWICTDVKDINSDGRPDIILGNYALGFINENGLKPTWNIHTPFVVLENEKAKLAAKESKNSK